MKNEVLLSLVAARLARRAPATPQHKPMGGLGPAPAGLGCDCIVLPCIFDGVISEATPSSRPPSSSR